MMAAQTLDGVAQEIFDHKEECTRLSKSVDKRLARIEQFMIGIAVATIMTLLTVTGALAVELYRTRVAQLDRAHDRAAEVQGQVTLPPGYAIVKLPPSPPP